MAEVVVEKGDLDSGLTNAFTNIVGWADSAIDFEEKIREYLLTFNWHVLELERVRPVDFGSSYSPEIDELIIQAQSNPKALLLATFFSFKPE